jgi:hypothetical protein
VCNPILGPEFQQNNFSASSGWQTTRRTMMKTLISAAVLVLSFGAFAQAPQTPPPPATTPATTTATTTPGNTNACTNPKHNLSPQCQQVCQACVGAKFVPGQAAKGTGLWADCFWPLLKGKTNKHATMPLPTLPDPSLAANCLATNPPKGKM